MNNTLKALVIECSDIMLNGIMQKISESRDIQITGKIYNLEHLSNDISLSDDSELILIGPMFYDIYGAEVCNNLVSKFPGKKTLTFNYEDYPSNIVEKIKNLTNGVEI